MGDFTRGSRPASAGRGQRDEAAARPEYWQGSIRHMKGASESWLKCSAKVGCVKSFDFASVWDAMQECCG